MQIIKFAGGNIRKDAFPRKQWQVTIFMTDFGM